MSSIVKISATQARNNIGKLWEMASIEPVMVEKAGRPIAVVLSAEEYKKLNSQVTPRKIRTMKHLFEGVYALNCDVISTH